MKRLIFALLTAALIPLSGCGLITPDTPFFGGFIDTTPPDLRQVNADVQYAMKAVSGTKPWEYTVLEDSRIAGRVDADGYNAWCTNFVVAVDERLREMGYTEDQTWIRHCSAYDLRGPDHVVLVLHHPDGHDYYFDSRERWVQRKDELPETPWKDRNGKYHFPYMWWEFKGVDNWVRTAL